MKKYLFGLGAMLVGAGLMFVLMHGEVEADDKGTIDGDCKQVKTIFNNVEYCRIKDLSCAISHNSISCALRIKL